MKIEKVLVDVSRRLAKELTKSPSVPVRFGQYETKIVISLDGYFAVLIPEQANIFRHDLDWRTMRVPCDWNVMQLQDTHRVEKIGNKPAKILCQQDGGETWETKIEEKLTKYFSDDAKYYQRKQNDVVYIAENGELCGMIMPLVLQRK